MTRCGVAGNFTRKVDQPVTTVLGKDDENLEFVDDWRSPGDVPEAVNHDWVGTTQFQLTAEDIAVPLPEAVAQGAEAASLVPNSVI